MSLSSGMMNFNVGNHIVRDIVRNKIKQEMEEIKLEKTKEALTMKEEKSIFYYYKRWIWVQFPWCTIDVYSNLSKIMEMSMGSQSNYISTYKENELVNGTIQILKEAKFRKKNIKKTPVSTKSPTALNSPKKSKTTSTSLQKSINQK